MLHPNERDLVFVAAGVGITPMLSMLRHMRSVNANLSVLLLYGNRREPDIIARAELDSIAAERLPRLKVVHVLSDPPRGGREKRVASKLRYSDAAWTRSTRRLSMYADRLR